MIPRNYFIANNEWLILLLIANNESNHKRPSKFHLNCSQPTEDYQPDSEDTLVFPRTNGIRDATIVLMKEKGGRYTLLRVCLTT